LIIHHLSGNKKTGMNLRIYNHFFGPTKKYMKFICFLICLFVASTVFSQNNISGPDISNAYSRSENQYIQEKLYVHTDKDTYISREILWFRIYFLDGFYNRPGSFSKIAYIEILDKNNLAVVQQKASLKAGESSGSLVIPTSLPSGMYKFRAYSNWMKNFGAEGFFEKPIRILNPNMLENDSATAKSQEYDIQFFPEGGNLVQNLANKVGFRITDRFGKGQDFESILVSSNGDTILKFRPLHMGLGNFSFIPVAGQVYRAIIQVPNRKQIQKELPVPYPSGLVMSIKKNMDSEVVVKVISSTDMDTQAVYLFVNSTRAALPLKKGQLSNHQAEFLIKSAELQDGISRFTLFNQEGQPVSERLFFKYPENKFLISAATDPEYAKRKKINLDLLTRDQAGKPVSANMSLAVYRIDSLQNVDESDIISYYYLIAGLGPVESPAFYFRDTVKAKEENIDNLMLTHGWRKYNWEQLLKGKSFSPVYAPELNGHIIVGKVVNGKTHSAVPNADTYLSIPSGRTQFRTTTSDSKGMVKFELTDFYGSEELISQVNTKKDTVSQVEISNPFSQEYSPFPVPAFSAPSKFSTTLLDQSIHEQVQHIYDGPKLNRFEMQPVDTNTFYVVPDEKYMLDDYTRFITMEEVIREYVKSSKLMKKRNNFYLYLFDLPHDAFFSDDPLILIDGVPFFNTDEFFLQDPKKIKRLELVNREYALGEQSFDGILNATTYQGDLDGIQLNAHATILDYPGIPEQREFFSPKYETEKQINSHLPDFRTLLYWSPEMISGTDGKTRAGFYSSDLPGKYAVVVQGLSESGVPGNQVIFFNVKK
jgi:hypothetical protein